MANWVAQPTWTTELVSSVKLGKHSQGITHVKERWDRAMVLTGATDAAVGDLLVLDPSVTDGVALADTAGQAGPILVALEALDAGGVAGQVRAGGFVTINISDDVAKGDLVQVSSTGLGELAPDASTAFAIATSGATAPGQVSVLMLPVGGAGSGGGGGGGSGSLLWDPTGVAVPPVVTALSVHNNWSLAGVLTTFAQYGDVALFTNPASAGTNERGVFGTTSGPYAVPAPPYTVTACVIPNFFRGSFWSALLSLRNSANDKRVSMKIGINASAEYEIQEVDWTDATNLSATIGVQSWREGFPIWLRIRDNATTQFFEYARDGVTWNTYASRTTGTFTAPDQAGVTSETFAGSSGTLGSITILSLSVVNTA